MYKETLSYCTVKSINLSERAEGPIADINHAERHENKVAAKRLFFTPIPVPPFAMTPKLYTSVSFIPQKILTGFETDDISLSFWSRAAMTVTSTFFRHFYKKKKM